MTKAKEQIKIICSGEETIWESREEAKAFYLKGMMESDGSERDRYAKIYEGLCLGLTICSDEDE